MKCKNRIMFLFATVLLCGILSAYMAVSAETGISGGDYNGDGVVNICDFVCAKKQLANPALNPSVDYDAINSENQSSPAAQLTALRKYLLGDSKAFENSADSDLSDQF